MFEDNFIHADLHGGNVLERDAPEAPGNITGIKHPQLVLLDAGLTIELRPFDRKNFISLFRAVIDNDGREVARLMMEYSPRTRAPPSTSTSTSTSTVSCSLSSEKEEQKQVSMAIAEAYATVIKPDEYKEEMSKLVAYVHSQGLSLSKISVGDLLRDVLRLSYDHNVKLESRFVSVVVAIMLAEGMGRRLDPEVDIIERATPFIRSAAVQTISDTIKSVTK